MNIFTKLIHKIEHIYGSNTGRIISWHDNENVFVAFRCDKCGEISNINIIKLNKEPEYGE